MSLQHRIEKCLIKIRNCRPKIEKRVCCLIVAGVGRENHYSLLEARAIGDCYFRIGLGTF